MEPILSKGHPRIKRGAMPLEVFEGLAGNGIPARERSVSSVATAVAMFSSWHAAASGVCNVP